MGLEENTKKVKVAIIGAGNMAKEHIKAFRSLDNTELVGIYSRTKEKSESLAFEFGIGGVYDSISDLYESTKADIVVITVSVAAMFRIAVEASEFAWAMFLEKPPAIDFFQAKELQKILNEKECKAYVALNRRFLSSSLVAKENLEKLDDPRFVYVQDQQPLTKIKEMNVHPDTVIENWMYANSIHLIDYFSNFCRGEIKEVITLDKWKGVDETEIVTAHIKYTSGDKGIYECRFKGPGPWAVTISNEKIRWELKPLELASYITGDERTIHQAEQSDLDKNFKPGFVIQAKNVVNAFLGIENKSPTLDDCIKTMKLISEIY